jgi:dihydropteroate synthase
MGIVNCTPDSFSDGGRLPDVTAAVDHALRLLADGADLVDVGGESTRPGASPVDAVEEIRRVVPVIEALRDHRPGALISVDTSKAVVARRALECGADLVNDVTAASDPDMLDTVVEHDAGIVLMHMRGSPRTMQDDTAYDDVVAEVYAALRGHARRATDAGLPADLVWLDPGVGFGKDTAGNLALLAAVPQLAASGHPVVVGASRKSFIGRLAGGADPDRRVAGSLAALMPSLEVDRAVVRVHDVAETVQFLDVATAIREHRT